MLDGPYVKALRSASSQSLCRSWTLYPINSLLAIAAANQDGAISLAEKHIYKIGRVPELDWTDRRLGPWHEELTVEKSRKQYNTWGPPREWATRIAFVTLPSASKILATDTCYLAGIVSYGGPTLHRRKRGRRGLVGDSSYAVASWLLQFVQVPGFRACRYHWEA